MMRRDREKNQTRYGQQDEEYMRYG
jgi:hypothetical protein